MGKEAEGSTRPLSRLGLVKAVFEGRSEETIPVERDLLHSISEVLHVSEQVYSLGVVCGGQPKTTRSCTQLAIFLQI